MADAASFDNLHWYAVQTKPKQETRAEANLHRWGLETLLPRLREVRSSGRDARSYRVLPLFPNYLFVRFGAYLVAKVRLTRGIQRIVGFGEYATPVDDGIIALIRSRIADDGFVRAAELLAGDVVEIVNGPLRSFEGVFERHLRAGDRVQILLMTIGCRARVQVGRDAIRKSSRPLASRAPRGLE
jgi:transcriptional antiterminator RfaH